MKPHINQYPMTDSRTYLNFDGTVNWQKYAEALDEYIELIAYILSNSQNNKEETK